MIGSVGSIVVDSDQSGTHHVEFVMGMAVSIDIRDPGAANDTVAEVVSWLHHVDATFGDVTVTPLGQ